jgi:hypothetical protein
MADETHIAMNKKAYLSIKETIDEKNFEIAKLLSAPNTQDLIQNKPKEQPVKYGKNMILFYYKAEPFIVIGPHCKN